MKALTLTQPWASLVAMGVKTIETRSSWTNHRGPLAIHAAMTMPPDAVAFAVEERHAHKWLPPWYELPLGAIVAVVDVIGCSPVESIDPDVVSIVERGYGNYSPGRFGWIFAREEGRRVELAEPVYCRGHLGLWDVPADIAARLPELPAALDQAKSVVSQQ